MIGLSSFARTSRSALVSAPSFIEVELLLPAGINAEALHAERINEMIVVFIVASFVLSKKFYKFLFLCCEKNGGKN
jgi:hypothetical protein